MSSRGHFGGDHLRQAIVLTSDTTQISSLRILGHGACHQNCVGWYDAAPDVESMQVGKARQVSQKLDDSILEVA